MSRPNRALGRGALAALALMVILPGCGGSSGGGSNSPNTPAPPPAPVRSLVVQGNFNLGSIAEANRAGLPADVWRHAFSTSGTGTLEVNSDWTFAGSQMAVGVLRGDCSFDQIYADACSEAGGAFPSGKPGRLTISALPAGTYTLAIVNVNNYGESGNYQVYLTR